MLWQELTKIALMGTERSQLSESIKTALQAKGIRLGNDEARMIMEGASYYAMMHKSGMQAKVWDRPIPTPAPKELPENACSPEAIQCLHQIIDGAFPGALNEFIHLLQKHGRHLPAELLPNLLDQCRQSPSLWEKLRDCLGARGAWLVQQNPEWLFLQQSPDPEIWETGTKDQRMALLKSLRLSQPEEGLALLEASWETESLQSRIAFLKIMETGLSSKDESFLEKCLDDRRKEVRQLAASILVKIASAALLERMYQRTIALFVVSGKKKIKLEVNLPEELSPEMIRDGIDPRNQWYQGGVKASRLGQMLAVIPPLRWEKYFDKSREEVLAIFLKSNWSELFFTAISMAAALHQDSAWMEAILRIWFVQHHQADWQNLDLQMMTSAIPAEVFNKMAIEGLEKDATLVENSAPVSILLKELDHPWEDRLSILFFGNLKAWLKNNPGQYWNAWHFWNILEKAAYQINPFLLPTLQRAFDKDAIWYQAGEEIDKFTRVLKFRLKMAKGLGAKMEGA